MEHRRAARAAHAADDGDYIEIDGDAHATAGTILPINTRVEVFYGEDHWERAVVQEHWPERAAAARARAAAVVRARMVAVVRARVAAARVAAVVRARAMRARAMSAARARAVRATKVAIKLKY
jgi:hypothetical protein